MDDSLDCFVVILVLYSGNCKNFRLFTNALYFSWISRSFCYRINENQYENHKRLQMGYFYDVPKFPRLDDFINVKLWNRISLVNSIYESFICKRIQIFATKCTWKKSYHKRRLTHRRIIKTKEGYYERQFWFTR